MKAATIPAEYAADTRRVCELADADFRLGGYFDDIARAHGHCSGKSAADDLSLWDMTVAEAAAIIAAPTEPGGIKDHLDDIYIGRHRVINMEVNRSIRDLLATAEKSDHWHDLDEAKRQTVEQLLDFNCDYSWTPAQ